MKNGLVCCSVVLAMAMAPCAFAQMQIQSHLPQKVAVYVTGGKTPSENMALSARLTHALVSSGEYNIIERADAFLDQVAKEMIMQMSGAIDDSQISALGQQTGADFVCIGEMLEAFGEYQMSARIVNVVSVEVVASGLASGPLNTMADFAALSDLVVALLLGEEEAIAQALGVAESAGEAMPLASSVEYEPLASSVAASEWGGSNVVRRVTIRRGTAFRAESRRTFRPASVAVSGGTYFQAGKQAANVGSISYPTTTATRALTAKHLSEDQNQERRAQRPRRDEHATRPRQGYGESDRHIHDRSATRAQPDTGTQRPRRHAPDGGQQHRRRSRD